MNRPFHYETLAAVISAAQLCQPWFLEAFGALAGDEAAAIAIEIATSSQMTDEFKPTSLYCATVPHSRPMATQVDIKDPVTAAMLTSGDHFYPLMARGDRFHFDPSQGWPKVLPLLRKLTALGGRLTLAEKRALGVAFHAAADTDGPHKDYLGFPHKMNLKISEDRLRRRGKKLSAKIRFMRWIGQSDEAWGHMADPGADEIQNCRMEAYLHGARVYATVSGYKVEVPRSAEVGKGMIVVAGGKRVRCLENILNARNDEHLAALQGEAFLESTGLPLPPFKGYTGEALAQWCEGVV